MLIISNKSTVIAENIQQLYPNGYKQYRKYQIISKRVYKVKYS